MPASIACAKAGVTTGEWAGHLRRVYGEYRAPTGVAATGPVRNDERIMALRDDVDAASKKLGRKFTFLVAKPGLDGHSNGAEQIAIRARDAGMDVIYNGIRFTADEIVADAKEKQAACHRAVDPVGQPCAAGGRCRGQAEGGRAGDVKVVAGGIIPAEDEARLKAGGRLGRLQPQGLRPQPDHARHRRSGRGVSAQSVLGLGSLPPMSRVNLYWPSAWRRHTVT